MCCPAAHQLPGVLPGWCPRRAPKPALPDVGNFDDLLAEARQQTAAAPPAAAEQQEEGAPGGSAAAPAAAGKSPFDVAAARAAGGGSPAQEAGQEAGQEEEEDLLIMDLDEEEEAGGEGVRLVELPSSTKKKAPRMPFITQARRRWGSGGGIAAAPCMLRDAASA